MNTLPNDYQNFIALSRYARWLPEKNRRETWKETVARYFDFMEEHLKENTDYTVTSDSIPLGTGTEIVKVSALKKISSVTMQTKYREHVTTWFHDNPTLAVQSRVPAPVYLRNKSHRLTIDTRNDLTLMGEIFNEFYTLTSPLLFTPHPSPHPARHR